MKYRFVCRYYTGDTLVTKKMKFKSLRKAQKHADRLEDQAHVKWIRIETPAKHCPEWVRCARRPIRWTN